MGKDDAWWSVLTEHERGAEISDARKKVFYESGVSHVNDVLQWTGLGGGNTKDQTLLDFGCGVGRLAFPFAERFGRVACVDQSMYHLRLARREWAARLHPARDPVRNVSTHRQGWWERVGSLGFFRSLFGARRRHERRRERQLLPVNEKKNNIDFVLSSPDLLGALGGRTFDLVHSVIVLQHMVSPLQTVYIEQLCDALKMGGRGWLHIPVHIPEEMHLGKFHMGRSRTCNLQASMEIGGMQAQRAHHSRVLALTTCTRRRFSSAQMHYTPARFVRESLQRRGCDAHTKKVGDWGIGGNMTAAFVTFTKVRPAQRPAAASRRGGP
jgi:cyclopropane fatty-acyl-phospholipid synthase-like methyltransferase